MPSAPPTSIGSAGTDARCANGEIERTHPGRPEVSAKTSSRYPPAAGRTPMAITAAGGYLLLAFADSFRWPGWIRSLSPFAHLASVPAEPMDVTGAVGMVVVALLLAVLGLYGYARRDLRG